LIVGAFILAEMEISPKFIFGMIFLFIWLVSAFVSWVNKQQQQARQRRLRLEAEVAARIGHRPTPPPPLARQQPMPQAPASARRPPQRIAEGIAQRFPDVLLPPAPPPIPQQQRQRPAPPPPPRPAQQRRPAKQQPRRAVPSLPTQPLVELTPADAPYVNITQPATRTKAPTVDADAIHAWMTPATLRQQFILTELLQPPLAMRDEPDH
jgi:hypothetical protein